MNKPKLAVILAATAVLAMSPANAVGQPAAQPVNMGLQLRAHADGGEVIQMSPDGTGAAMGLQIGDIIVEVDGTPISPQVAQEHSQRTSVGDQIRFKVKRAGALLDLTGTAVGAPEGAQAPMAQPQQ